MWVLVVAVVAVLAPASALAGSRDAADPPSVEIVRAPEAPVLDGKLDDEVWGYAAKIDRFVQQSPREGEPATEQTEVWMAYDSHHLYFAFYAHYSDPSLIRANRVDRDKTWRDDTIAVYFDSFLDRQRGYKFSVNGYGVQGDAVVTAGGGRGGPHGGGGGMGRPGEDASWDALFESKGGLVADGWIVEMAIPFKSLRYPSKPAGDPHRWGFQILRTIESKNEEVVWAPVSRNIAGFLTQMGEIRGFRDLSTSKNLEILPTLTAVQFGAMDRSTGAFRERSIDPDVGLNVKYGVTTNLTADFTVNPDFSQIESDRPQITVNQRFPLFYEEKRPFFLEGKEIFDTQINLIHTRTIVDPQVGGKLTGKIGSTTVGVLFADDKAPGLRDSPADPAFGRSATVFLGRVRYDLYKESFLGAVVTDREFMGAYNRVAGVDGRFRLGTVHLLGFMAVASQHRNEAGVETGGPAFEVEFRRSARRFSYGLQHTNYAAGFRADTGFIRRTDIAQSEAEVNYRFWPGNALVSWGPRVEYQRNYDHAGVLQDESLEGGVNFEFKQNFGFRLGASQSMERYRGIDFDKTNVSFGGNVNASRFISWGFGGHRGDGIRYGRDPFLGRSTGAFGGMTVRPTPRIESNLTMNLSRLTRPDTGAEVFDVKIVRTRTTYQFSDRLLLRNIMEYETYAGRFGANLLLTYRINAGTVAFLGYDDRLERAVNINDELFDTRALTRTNRAFFLKVSYLFRY